ncbi:hypothetical protein BDF19DRAFT_437063 [Syncephalis fuscata]|nr:hypothetical protein BDF19DRAFT_437063 [Syncephalis fuscata]
MFLATLCNIICLVIVIMFIGKAYSDQFFILDWVVVTTILVHHCQNIGKSVGSAHQPKTEHMLHLSQIATVKSIDHHMHSDFSNQHLLV